MGVRRPSRHRATYDASCMRARQCKSTDADGDFFPIKLAQPSATKATAYRHRASGRYFGATTFRPACASSLSATQVPTAPVTGSGIIVDCA